MSTVSAFLVSMLSGAGFLAAGLLGMTDRRLDARGRSVAVAVAAGVLLAVAFADLFPEALELAGDAAIWGFAGGFALLLVVETLTHGHTHHTPDEHVHHHALTPFIVGLAVHNVADGFSLGVSSDLSTEASVGVGIGVLVHQIPVGLSLAAVLLAARIPRGRMARIAVPLAAAIPIAATVTAAFPAAGDRTLGTLIGIAGGVLVYMGAAHLLPEAQSERRSRLPGAVFVVTLAVTTLTLLTLGHDH